VRFSTMSGVLVAHPRADGTIMLDFPAAQLVAAPVPDGLADALGVEPAAVYRTGSLRDLLTVLPDEATVRRLAPDLASLTELLPREDIRGIIATAGASEPSCGYDFVSRFFSPAEGIPEDPVTGSAHTALAPYWVCRLERDGLTGLQAAARTGLVRTAVHGDRVHLTGRGVTVIDGELARAARPYSPVSA
ncbi:MAG: PhzF family phenazine biosynthesis protein, partial [Pseudonocardia sp.]